jgi:endonuclease/exonuclease/phosphatase family metal-dependent hydrolase
VRVVTWNIQWGRGRDGRVDLRRCADTLYQAEADLICLQEVAVNHPGLPGGAAMDQVAMLAGLLSGYEWAFGPASDLPDGLGGRRQFGNMLLSRLPLGQVFRHALPMPADSSVPGMARAALEAVVAAPWGPLRVVTTHLEFYSRRQRTAQIEALRRICGEGWEHACQPSAATDADPPFAVLPRGEGVLLCGDFNCPPDGEEMALLTARMPTDDPAAGTAVPPAPTMHDAWTVRHGDCAHAPTAGLVPSPYFSAPVCYDRAYLGENLLPYLREVAVDGFCAASDHQPLVLDLF